MSILLNFTGQEMQGTGRDGYMGHDDLPDWDKSTSGRLDQWIVDS